MTFLLDDLRRWIEIHAEVGPSSPDHLGHLATREEAIRRREAMIADRRAAVGPQEAHRAQRWARQVLSASRAFQARRPRRAAAIDYARALSAAVRQADGLRRAGMPVPGPADLIAAVADPVVVQPEPEPETAKIGIIAIPSAGDHLGDWVDDPGEDVEDRPVAAQPLPADLRQSAGNVVLEIIVATIEQIDRVLALLIHLDPDQGRHTPDGPATARAAGVELGPPAQFAIAAEVIRLRDAEHARRLASISATLTAPPATGPDARD